jgi:hypothetical protein
MFIQDVTYWVYIGKEPVQWSWYYPVVDSFPLLYPVAVIIVILAYMKSPRNMLKIYG